MNTTLAVLGRHLFVHAPPLSGAERWRSSLGALLCVALCAVLLRAVPGASFWLLAPIGASIVILFVQPHSPLAQPWPVLGSYLIATAVGLGCAIWIPHAPLAAALSVGLTVWLMARLHCIHPPGGAMALLIVLDAPHSASQPLHTTGLIACNIVLTWLGALAINTLILRRRSPFAASEQEQNRHGTHDAKPMDRMGLTHADLASAVSTLNTFVDVQEDELVGIYNLAIEHAVGRHVWLSCADIMSRDVITAHFDTDLETAWLQLRDHKIKSLPVVDRFERLVGIVTVADFLRQMDKTSAAGIAVRLQGLLRRTPGLYSEKAEVVGQIMTTSVFHATPQTTLAELVRQMSDRDLPHIPVIDEQRRVLGIITQSDMLAALYKQIALAQAR